MGSSPVAVTESSDIALVSSKEFLDYQATIECGFTLKRVRDMIKTYSTSLTNISTEMKKQIGICNSIWYVIKCRKDLVFKFNWYVQENYVFIEEESNPSKKVVIIEEQLGSFDIDGFRNLVDLPRLMFIGEEWK